MSHTITAMQLKELRSKLGLSSRQAAEVVGITPRQWIKYESEDADIPEKVIEYFCLKKKFPFPPIDTEGNLLFKAKKIVIANYKGGTGKTLITFNVGCLLLKENLRVLLVDASSNHTLLKIHERVRSFSMLCPKVISLDEYNVDSNEFDMKYDYIIFDNNMTCVSPDLLNSSINLVLTPTFLSLFDVDATKKTHLEISKYVPLNKVFAMVIGYDTCSIVDSAKVDLSVKVTTNDQIHKNIIEIQDQYYGDLISNNIGLFDTFTTKVIDYYVHKMKTLDDFLLLVQNQPGAWVTKELQNITNEIKSKSIK